MTFTRTEEDKRQSGRATPEEAAGMCSDGAGARGVVGLVLGQGTSQIAHRPQSEQEAIVGFQEIGIETP